MRKMQQLQVSLLSPTEFYLPVGTEFLPFVDYQDGYNYVTIVYICEQERPSARYVFRAANQWETLKPNERYITTVLYAGMAKHLFVDVP